MKRRAVGRMAIVVAALAGAGCHGPRTTTTGQTTVTSAELPIAPPPVASTPDVAGLVARVSPSVVNITATQEIPVPPGLVDPFQFFFGRRAPRGGHDDVIRSRALGSGFIVDDAGHVVTNAHVVEDADSVRVTLADEREFDADVKGRDPRLDLAVLELKGAKNLPRAPVGSSGELRVGDYVVAIGNPFGLGNTVTMGIVSAKGRELGAGPYDDFIQTDASINPGNSGGPLFNLRGEVVGISTAIVPAGQGIGFAIPSDALKEVLPQLVEKGSVSRGRLGVALQRVDTAVAKSLGLDQAHGALVAEVEPGGPAARAGIKPGEVIVRIDGTPIAHAHELPRVIARHAPGTRVSVEVIGADKRTRTVGAVLDAVPEEHRPAAPTTPPPAASRGDFGIDFGDAGRGGATVRAVDPSGPAADMLRPGDLVVEVNGAAVRSASEAQARIRATPPDRAALLRVRRDGQTRFIALERR